jgi:hypothetical protein
MKQRLFAILILLMGCGWQRFYYPMDMLEPNDSISQSIALSGETLKASIHPNDWTDFYKFDVIAGEKVRFVYDEASNKNVQVRVELLDSVKSNEFTQGRELTQNGSDKIVVEFTRSQTYYLRVTGGAASWEGIIVGFNDEFTQLEYSLRLERNPAQTATIRF